MADRPRSFYGLSLTLALTTLALLFVPRGAAADQYHYGNALIGDRASGMGGAYTAVADDATGLYYNPAGIAYATGKNISASVNAYHSYIKSYKGVVGGKDWDRRSSALLPNYFGVVQPLGRFKIGFSYAVPDTSKEDQDQIFTNVNATVGRYVINFNNDDNTYNFGPSIAMEISDALAAGFTLYFHQRSNQFVLNQLINFYDATNEWKNQYFETNEDGLRPVLGVMWSPFKKLSLGMAVSKVFLYNAATTGQIYCSDSSAGGCDGATITADPFYPVLTDSAIITTDARKKYPVHVAIGAAYFVSDELLLTGDVKYYGKVTDSQFGNREAVVNIALGAEYFLSSATALRAGLFTDQANTKEVLSGLSGQPEHVDLMGLSASISNFTRNTSVTIGGSYFQGKGKAQMLGGTTAIQDIEANGWSMFLSSSYLY